MYYLGVTGIVAGMSLSKPAVSMGLIICGIAALLEGNFKQRIIKTISHPLFVVAGLFLVMHFTGLLYSTELGYGLKDIKTKLPLFFIPVIFIGSNIFSLKTNSTFILSIFIASLVVCTLLSFSIYFHWIKSAQYDGTNMRTMIFGVSPVRLALFISMAIFLLGYAVFQNQKSQLNFIYIILIFWFLFFQNFVESGTGVVLAIALLSFSVVYIAAKHLPRGKAILCLSLFGALGMFCSWKAYEFISDSFVELPGKKIPAKTIFGENYSTDKDLLFVENGYLAGKGIAPNELKEAWAERSILSITGKDRRGQNLRVTLIRYLNSLGKLKDKAAVLSLTDQDIRNIEAGIANAHYTIMNGWKKRLVQILFEFELYRKGLNPFGNSITQRFEYWKIAGTIIRANPLTGVGTGDVQAEFNKIYDTYPMGVDAKYRLRAHNQYLTIAVTFGIIGLLVFVFYATGLLWMNGIKQLDYGAWIFLIIMLLSFLSEDTLETQSGVTFVAFFYTFFQLRHSEGRLTQPHQKKTRNRHKIAVT